MSEILLDKPEGSFNTQRYLALFSPTRDWRESQFFFTSRLPGEPTAGVSNVHFTPGTPRSFLGGLAVQF